MRPLNRPMFRNGGPIKEGIMDGIKEPQAINTVGSPIFPKSSDGRSKHAIGAAPFIYAAGRAMLRPLGKFATRAVQRTFAGPNKRYYEPAGFSKNVKESVFQPNIVGRYIMGSPEFKTGKAIVQGSGKFGKPIKSVAKGIASSPLTAGSILYYGGGALLPDGTPDPEDPKNYKPAGEGGKSGAPGGGDPNMFLEPREKKMSDEEKKAAMDKEMDARKKYYYELMGMDKMKKDAAYNTLIDASNQIREGGNIKDQLKSGNLISGVINSLSKNLDKSVDLKKQIDAAILKAEITKDVNREKDQLDSKVKNAQLALYNKKLDGLDLRESIASYYDKNKVMPSGSQLSSLARVTEGIDTKVEDTQAVKDWMEENNSNEAGYFETLVKSGNLPAGNYVINNRIFNFDGEKITALL